MPELYYPGAPDLVFVKDVMFHHVSFDGSLGFGVAANVYWQNKNDRA
jgi:hypothetical protein